MAANEDASVAVSPSAILELTEDMPTRNFLAMMNDEDTHVQEAVADELAGRLESDEIDVIADEAKVTRLLYKEYVLRKMADGEAIEVEGF